MTTVKELLREGQLNELYNRFIGCFNEVANSDIEVNHSPAQATEAFIYAAATVAYCMLREGTGKEASQGAEMFAAMVKALENENALGRFPIN